MLSARAEKHEAALKNLLLIVNGLQYNDSDGKGTGKTGALSPGAKRLLTETAGLMGVDLPVGRE